MNTQVAPVSTDQDQSVCITVLIVEDHEITRIGLRTALAKVPGLTIVGEAADGPSAITASLELHPDVVLLDIGLPGLDGIAVAARLRLEAPDIRIIMLTSHDNDDDIFAALGAGAHGYCLKDISSSYLTRAIRAIASGAAWLDPAIASRVLKATATAHNKNNPPIRPVATNLSKRELEVLGLVVEGLTNARIAECLFLSIETVKTHMQHIMEKLVVSDRTQAAVKATREGLVFKSLPNKMLGES